MSVRIVHKRKGYAALLRGPELRADIQRRAEAVAAACGDGFVAEKSSATRPLKTGQHRRARSAVIAVTFAARRKNSRDNVLIRSLDAGR